jgi:hypothetical protein
MRLRLGSLAFVACLCVLAGSAAHAAKPKQADFRVALTGKLTKEWTFTQVQEEGDCTRTTRGAGRWEAKLSTRRPGRLRAVAAGGGKVRFVGTVTGLMGTATKSGTMTIAAGGDPPCERSSRSLRCGRQERAFSGASTTVRNRRKGIVQLGALRGVDAARSPRSNCPSEPADIRSIRTDLSLATAPLDAADVFGRNVPRFFTSGDTEQVTTLEGDVEGRVTERVRWTLVFTRVAR